MHTHACDPLVSSSISLAMLQHAARPLSTCPPWARPAPPQVPKPVYIPPKLPPPPPDLQSPPPSALEAQQPPGEISQGMKVEATPLVMLTWPEDTPRLPEDSKLQGQVGRQQQLAEYGQGPAAAASGGRGGLGAKQGGEAGEKLPPVVVSTASSRPPSAAFCSGSAAAHTACIGAATSSSCGSSSAAGGDGEGGAGERPLSRLSIRELQEQWSSSRQQRAAGDSPPVITGDAAGDAGEAGEKLTSGRRGGEPLVWLSYAAPFAEPPPLVLPPKPVPGPEPSYQGPEAEPAPAPLVPPPEKVSGCLRSLGVGRRAARGLVRLWHWVGLIRENQAASWVAGMGKDRGWHSH